MCYQCENFSRDRVERLLPAPLKSASMTVWWGIISAKRSAIHTLRTVVAVGARDTLGSPNRLLRGIQQTIQHLADRAVFAIERIGVHDRSLFSLLPLNTIYNSLRMAEIWLSRLLLCFHTVKLKARWQTIILLDTWAPWALFFHVTDRTDCFTDKNQRSKRWLQC